MGLGRARTRRPEGAEGTMQYLTDSLGLILV